MAANEVAIDEKAKRMRDLLSSYYSTDQTSNNNNNNNNYNNYNSNNINEITSKYATLDTINSPSFDPVHYMNLLVQKSNLETLLQRHVEMAAEIKNLDTDLQMLVYENYNKFISATDTIKRMNSNIVGMETNMEQLLEKILSVQSRSDGVNTSLFEKREHIEKLHRTRNFLRKIQFIYDLPERLGKCIKSEAYADAVKFYTGAMPIFKAYGESSFQDCKKLSEEAVSIIIKNLEGKVFSDSESIQARAEAVMLLKQLDFPVDNLKDQLFEKMEQSLGDVQLHFDAKSDQHSPDHVPSTHEVSTCELVEAARAYRVIFPDSQQELVKISHDLIIKHFETIEKHIENQTSSTELLKMLRLVWDDVLLMDEVLPEASVAEICLKAANHAVKLYISGSFSNLLQDISDSLAKVQVNQKENVKEDYPLQVKIEASKKAIIRGSMGVLQDFRLLVDDSLALLIRMKDMIVDWVQEGFQDFFISLYNHFLLLSGKNNLASQDLVPHDGMPGDKTLAGLVLVLAQLSVFIDQTAMPRITEEIAASFSGGSVREYESGPAFVPSEICRIFRSSAEMFLRLYITMKTQRVSVLLKKRFTTPNWIKHKEPREVHMFVDLFLQELQEVLSEVKQLLPESPARKHRRADSVSNSSTSSRSNALRDDKLLTRSNTQKARSQLLESHLAKLFKQKMEIFTKVDSTQDSVLTTIVKLCLKSLQEYVRLQTFSRSGFQQIQLDTQCLRMSLKDSVEDEAAVDFLLDEVIVATAERCLDPIPLEPAVLDRLVQMKLDKRKEQTSSSP